MQSLHIFLPGHARAVGQTGTSYIDDFEGAKSTIDLRQVNSWFFGQYATGAIRNVP